MDKLYDEGSMVYALFDSWVKSVEAGNPKKPRIDEFKNATKESAHRMAISFFRWVFEYLEIKPSRISLAVSAEFLKKYKLDTIFGYIIFPMEYSTHRFGYIDKVNYLARLIYPERFSAYELSVKYIWDTEYAKCEITKRKQNKYKILLTDDYDYNRKKITYLFCHYLRKNPVPGTNNDIKKCYDYFAGKKGSAYIAKAMLSAACHTVFESPLELFHLSLPETQRDEFLYNYELFKQGYFTS